MKYNELIIETKEFEVLKELIAMAPHLRDNTYKASIDTFLGELQSARKTPINKMPDDVVRLNTTVTIQDKFRNIHSYQIVKPEFGDLKANRISVLAPMALAVFGYALDDEIKWRFPVGWQTLKILKVEQTPIPNKITI
jgi:regulator of nucleoside diphosphate kinase